MSFGYVLISTKNSYEHRVLDELLNIDGVVDVEPLLVEETAMAEPFFEDYNLIAKIRKDSGLNIKKLVKNSIKNISGVKYVKFTSGPTAKMEK